MLSITERTIWMLFLHLDVVASSYCRFETAHSFRSFPRLTADSHHREIRMTSVAEDPTSSIVNETSPGPVKHHTLTVCMVPPPSETTVWEHVTAARTQLRDPGLYRWPPHVNMLYPFVSIKSQSSGDGDSGHSIVDQDIVRNLRAATQQCEPFHVHLDTLGTFGGAQRGVLWLHPRSVSQDADENDNVEPLIRLQALLEEQFPTCTDQLKQGRYSPHMTLSHYSSLDAAKEARTQIEAWWPSHDVSFYVDRIYLLQRKGDDGQFLRIATIALGESSAKDILDDMPSDGIQVHDPPEAFPLMATEEADWVREERMKLKERRNRSWKSGRRRRRSRKSTSSPGVNRRSPSRSRDSPEMIAAKRAERKAKRERLERERISKENSVEG